MFPDLPDWPDGPVGRAALRRRWPWGLKVLLWSEVAILVAAVVYGIWP